MPKFNNAQIAIKISRQQIIETGNIRTDYNQKELEELADSIFKDGLLNPLIVKISELDENGIQTYELICGHRRIRAIDILTHRHIEYPAISCCIKTGEKEVLQLIENIQRTDLSSTEKEIAVKSMLNKGLTQTEISKAICKPISWISDTIAGAAVREAAEKAGIETAEIKTRALSQLRSIPKEQVPEIVKKLKESGGTVRAATEILHAENKENPSRFLSCKNRDYAQTNKIVNQQEVQTAINAFFTQNPDSTSLDAIILFLKCHFRDKSE